MADRTNVANVIVEQLDDIALLRIQRGKGNSLSPALVEELLDALRAAPIAESARALVVTGEGRFFSSGLDLLELSKLDRAGMLLFLDRLQGLLATLYVFGRPVIAAVNGHAVAGGCLLALCADWRVFARGEARIGLNELTLGVPLPQAGIEIVKAHLTTPAYAEVVYGGQTHGTDDALRLKLVDEAVDPERVVAVAIERARGFARHPSVAFHHMKAALRDPVLLRIRAKHDQHEEAWVDLWFSPPAQQRIQEVRERLLARKSE
jgi:Delta3-Delta2-enoyl-CoA isomerase